MSNILLRKFAFIVLLFSVSVPSMASVPLGDCPEKNSLRLEIGQMMNSNDPSAAGFAYALMAKDANEDGYACALYRCIPCQPNAPRCNLICTFSGPVSDNDQ